MLRSEFKEKMNTYWNKNKTVWAIIKKHTRGYSRIQRVDGLGADTLNKFFVDVGGANYNTRIGSMGDLMSFLWRQVYSDYCSIIEEEVITEEILYTVAKMENKFSVYVYGLDVRLMKTLFLWWRNLSGSL